MLDARTHRLQDEHTFAMLSESAVDRLLNGKAVLAEDVRWTPQPSNPRWVQFAAFLDANSEASLRIVMAVNSLNLSKYPILVLRGDQVLRRLDVRGSHGNPPGASGEQWLSQTHKHRWTDAYGDKVAYTPPDVATPEPFDRSEYEATFRAFCAECNIEFTGGWQAPPEQQQELDL